MRVVWLSLRNWLRHRGVYGYWASPDKEDTAPRWAERRGWLHLGQHWTIGLEYYLFHRTLELMFGMDKGDGHKIHWCIGVPWVITLYLTLTLPWALGKWLMRWKDWGDRNIGFNVYAGGMWVYFWADRWGGAGNASKRYWHIDFADALFGRAKYTTEDLSTISVVIPMPEKLYPATCRMFMSTWKRPRWPIARKLLRADIDIPGGIPFPGKGESEWDMGDDATFSMTCVARNPQAAIGILVGSILERRGKYGGADWKPEPEKEAA